jgi:hypothetical protein
VGTPYPLPHEVTHGSQTLPPFGLSLSKPCPFLATVEEEGRTGLRQAQPERVVLLTSPFASSEVEKPFRAQRELRQWKKILGFARHGVSTSLDTNGVKT